MATTLALAVALCLPLTAWAGAGRGGMTLGIESEGFFLNPTVKKVTVTEVTPGSVPAQAGVVAGDEILAVEGHPVVGARALALKGYMSMEPGETRTLELRHANGTAYTARLTKPRDAE